MACSFIIVAMDKIVDFRECALNVRNISNVLRSVGKQQIDHFKTI